MLERILDHMNNDHKDVLPLYVKHFNNRDDVTDAKLINVTEEGMELLVNENEKVFVAFTKKTPFDAIHLEMVKMAKIARQALGIPAPEHYKEKGHQNEEKLKMEISDFVGSFKSVVLATLTEEGEPFLSYAPYVRYQGDSYIFISESAEHFHNLKSKNKLDILFIEDEEKTSSMSLRKRVRYKAVAEFTEKNDRTEEVIDQFEKIDRIIKMTRTMGDFHLVKLNLQSGRYVKGPGQAFDITEDRRVVAVTQGAAGIPHGGNIPGHMKG